jgi:glutaredoxin
MIDVITSTLCSHCLAVKAALSKCHIPHQEVDIQAIGPKDMAEITNAAVELVLNGKCASAVEAVCTPMIRYKAGGKTHVLFPVDLLDHGIMRIEALAALQNITTD